MKKALFILLALALAAMTSVLSGCEYESTITEHNEDGTVSSSTVSGSMFTVNEDPDEVGTTDPAQIADNFSSDDEPSLAGTVGEIEGLIDGFSEELPEDNDPVKLCLLEQKPAADVTRDEFSRAYDVVCSTGEYVEDFYLYCKNADMTSFRVVTITTDDDLKYHVSGDVQTVDTVKTGEAVHITLEVPETMPYNAVIYTAAGSEYVFVINYNGRDGGIVLTPVGDDEFFFE